MKLKEINRTAIQSWSPAQQHPVYLATGTSAQQMDASFSTSASLEIFELDLADSSMDMKSSGTLSSTHRYHKLVWGPHGMDGGAHPCGVLIAGGENGDVILYDPAKIMAGDSDVIIAQSDKHTGPVRALDVNSFQTNLVASGGNESEIYIWDLNNFGSPMTPGPKTQPLEDISCVAWNRQVQHILASASPSGRASVWDLRKNDLIIKVSDHSNRMHCSGLAWNPEVATQLLLASEDDRMPVIQMWDLRFATSPLKILENHTRGVLAIDWSLADPELLLSCGKDNRILCWNPNTAEVLYELPTSTQWCFDIQWCPRNPAVLSAASFDGCIGIYSIMGGTSPAQSQKATDQISTSFGNLDPFGMGQTLPPLQLPQTPAAPAVVTPLKKPPKWIRRPVGASFAFGGKLVSLENIKQDPRQPQQTTAHLVHVSQVVTEVTFLERSDQLQATLSAGSFVEFCQAKIDAAQNEFERTVWNFLKVNFENDARGKYLELLGYKKEELALKIAAALEEKPAQPVELAPVAAPTPATQPDTQPEPAGPGLSTPPQLDIQPPAPEPIVDLVSEPPASGPTNVLVPDPPTVELVPDLPAVDIVPDTPTVEIVPDLLPASELAVDFVPNPPASEPTADFVPDPPVVELLPDPPATELALDSVPDREPAVELVSVPLIEFGLQPESKLDLPPVSDLTAAAAPMLAPPSAPTLDLSCDPTPAASALPETLLLPDSDLSTSDETQAVADFGLDPLINLQPLSQFDQIDPQQASFGVDLLQPVPLSDFTDLNCPQAVPYFDPLSSSLNLLQPLEDVDLASLVSVQPIAELDLAPPPVSDQPIAELDLAPPPASDQPIAELDLAPPLVSDQPVAELDLAPPVGVQPIAELDLAPPIDYLPEDAFALIAAANLQPAAELEPAQPPEIDVSTLVPNAESGDSPEESPEAGALQPETSDDQHIPEDEEIPLEEEDQAAESSPADEAVEDAQVPTPAPAEERINLRVCQDVDGLITQALLTGDFEGAVELCIHDNRMADSIILAIAGGAELLEKTQKKYFTKTHGKITKLISAVVMKDWHDVLESCDLENWKEALAAVMTYAQPDEFSSFCDMLGSRLETAADSELQAQACLCYICAGNVEKLVSCWTRAQDKRCPLSLQDLVEKVVVLRKAVEQSQGSGPSLVGVLLAEKMSQYASLLASQGSLATALSYLPEDTSQVVVQQLHDRLCQALGQQVPAPSAPAPAPAQVAAPAPAPALAQQAQPPAPQHAAALPGQVYAGQPPVVSQPPPAPASAPVPATAPGQPQYYQPAELTPPMFGMQPPGPAVPPPVSTAPAYMYSHQYQPYPQVNQYTPGAAGPAIFQPLQYCSSAAATLPPPPCPASSSALPAPALGFRSQYMQPLSSQQPDPQQLYTAPLPMGQPGSPSLSYPPPIASSSFSTPSSGGSFQHGMPGSPVSYMPPPLSTGPPGPQNGWNDPPALSRVPKKKKVPENYTPPAPITAPIMSPLGGDPQAQQAAPMSPQPMVQGQLGVHSAYTGMQQHPLAAPPMNPALPKTSVEGAPGAPIGDVMQPMQSIPAEKITKKPIPEEHLVLKNTFEGLIQKCLAAANDPQTKRKLDDANKRLEALYDKLREQTLSPAIVAGLHNMVRSIESRSYAEGLGIHTHIVSNNNFSETSAFMPVLKVVLTQANRLGV